MTNTNRPTPPADLQAIADALTARGVYRVTVEFPGCIVVPAGPEHRAYWFGTANATWQGDLNDGAGVYLDHTLDTGVPSTETDPRVIAEAIATVMEGDGATTCTNSPACAARGCDDCERSYGPRR